MKSILRRLTHLRERASHPCLSAWTHVQSVNRALSMLEALFRAARERHIYDRDCHLCQGHSSTAATDRVRKTPAVRNLNPNMVTGFRNFLRVYRDVPDPLGDQP